MSESNACGDADSESELLSRIHQGDRAAFKRLFSLYYQRLSRFLGRLTTDALLIEEIIDDTLMVVWRKAGDFDARSQVSTWILGIAHRVAMKEFARRSARARASGVDPAPLAHDVAGEEFDPQGVELRELIELALRRLTADHRAVLELAYVMGYSCAEIAAIVDCPVNTVKTRLFHARERMRAIWPTLMDQPVAGLRENKE